ncbi:MAG: hypothetical protein J0L70_28215 [Leptolyngbya sp. UWPOB_LEPTO1]|uniref:hypothetical protein n=1 Tax=Leptolyngbya sp. UWPOB_LEPTO1 TaxID=2815653 RepID=UPI001AC32717|nr:hypothetical protein [Leptolyngbya sp. UWPOB_LEPTO1]MBN8564424.1 hypothetical protein [Leptolyngbya sp. UWPOB_LEPTO1]
MDKLILLSFDVEGFDVPEEYGQPLDKTIKFKASAEGLDHGLALLDRLETYLNWFKPQARFVTFSEFQAS